MSEYTQSHCDKHIKHMSKNKQKENKTNLFFFFFFKERKDDKNKNSVKKACLITTSWD